jgi:hypothetical protein
MMKIAFKESTWSASVVKMGIRLSICTCNSQMSRFQQPVSTPTSFMPKFGFQQPITRQFFIFEDPEKVMLKLLFFRYPNWAFSSKIKYPPKIAPNLHQLV